MRRALPFLLGLALAAPAAAQPAPGTLPLRGNLRVRSAISAEGRQWAQKLFPTLESGLFRIENTRLDWLGLADEGYRFSGDGWLAYRGAASAFTDARPQLTAIPGFEWQGSRRLSIYGADHLVPGRDPRPSWPALRVGRLAPDLDEQELRRLYESSLYEELRRGRILTLFDELYHESLGTDLVQTGGIYSSNQVDLSDLMGLEKPEFYPNAPPSSDPYALPTLAGMPPTESIWGPASAALRSDLDLDRGNPIAQQLQDPPGLTRMGNTALEVERSPGPARQWLPILTNRLRWGDPLSNNGWFERLPLTPGWRPDKVPEASRDNPQYQKMFGHYFTLLELGLNLFQSYGGGLSRTGLEQARYAWSQGTSSQQLGALPPAQQRSWGQLIDWLQQYDDQQTIVAQFNAPEREGPAVWLRDLDPRLLRGKSVARQRLGLLEVAYGQSGADFATSAPPGGGGGPIPGASPLVTGVASGTARVNLDYYNLALRNGWRVAPCSGLDNLGPLDRHQGKLVPQARSTFTGLYPGPVDTVVRGGQVNFSSNGPERIRQMLAGLAQRRTFVSENPYVDALLSARDLTTGRQVPMGGDLFQGSSSPVTFELTLQLAMPTRTQVTEGARIKVEDIKLVEVVERERELDANGRRLKIFESTRNPQLALGPQQMSLLVTDEVPAFQYYSSGAVAQPGLSAGVGTILSNYGLTGTPVNPPEPDTYPLPVTLTWRLTARPHQPGGILAYYVKARLPAMGTIPAGTIVTAPLWTVTDWNRFQSLDEAL